MFKAFYRGLLPGLILLAGCSSPDERDIGLMAAEVTEEDRYGGTAVIAAISDIPDMNPLTSTETLASEVQQHILFTPVITYDENFEPLPAHARAWEVNADTTELTFHLRDDLYWHDGVIVTAYDLAFAYELARNPQTGFPNSAYWTHYHEAAAVDSFTFRVELTPHAEFMDPWWNFTAMPLHILEDVEPGQLRTHPYSTRTPLGNGPFRFLNREDGQSWTFEANPDYPDDLGGRPYLDRIVYRVIPEATTMLTELITGRIDFYTAVLPEHADRVDSDRNSRLIHYPDRTFVYIGWNQRRTPFEDLRVRRALTMAMDRERIVDAVLYGYGELANSTVPPIFWQYDRSAGEGLTHDPERALELLAEAGWTPGPDGMLRNEEGDPFRFSLSTNHGNQVRADIAEIVQADLRRIGIDMQIRILEWGTLLDRIDDPVRRDFDAVLIGWRTAFKVDNLDMFHCDRRDEPYQFIGYCNPEVDRLLEELPMILDRDAALPYWQEYQQLIAHDQPYTFIYFMERLHGVRNRLQNAEPDPRGDWVGASKWWIPPQMR